MPWRAASSAIDASLPGEQRSGVADVEPLGEKTGGRDAAQRLRRDARAAPALPRRRLRRRRRDASSRLQGAAATPGPKRAKNGGEIVGTDALAAHAGVDLKMDGHGAGLRSGGARGG